MSDDGKLLDRARAQVEEKTQGGEYSRALLDSISEPLDMRPLPEMAGGISWREAVYTATVTVDPPAPSARAVVGTLVTTMERLVDRALRWYLPPLAEQISRHNRAVVDVLAQHNREIVELRRELDLLRRRVAILEAETKGSPPRGGG